MSNFSTKDIVEIVGISAVVASLIFVGIEIQQNSAVARLEARQRSADQDIEITMTIASSPELTKVAATVFSQDFTPGDLSPEEGVAAFFLFLGVFNMWQSTYDSVQEGILPQSAIDGIGEGILNNTFVRSNWPALSLQLDNNFVEFVETNAFVEAVNP